MPNKFEELEEKGAGFIKGATARMKGLTGVFKTLAEQHSQASVLLDHAKAADNAERRVDLWTKIRVELLSHERGELNVVYPEFLEHAETRGIAREHDREVSSLEAAITELDATDPETDLWRVRLESLIEMVKLHVDEEENEWFPLAIKVIGKEEAEDLNSRFLANKEAAVEQIR